MRRFRSSCQIQRLVSVHAVVQNLPRTAPQLLLDTGVHWMECGDLSLLTELRDGSSGEPRHSVVRLTKPDAERGGTDGPV
jgi:hypothetical protein